MLMKRKYQCLSHEQKPPKKRSLLTLRIRLRSNLIHGVDRAPKVDTQGRLASATGQHIRHLEKELPELIVGRSNNLVAKADRGERVEPLENEPDGRRILATALAVQYMLSVSMVWRLDVQPRQRFAGVSPVGQRDPTLIKIIEAKVGVGNHASSV